MLYRKVRNWYVAELRSAEKFYYKQISIQLSKRNLSADPHKWWKIAKKSCGLETSFFFFFSLVFIIIIIIYSILLKTKSKNVNEHREKKKQHIHNRKQGKTVSKGLDHVCVCV